MRFDLLGLHSQDNGQCHKACGLLFLISLLISVYNDGAWEIEARSPVAEAMKDTRDI